MHRLITVYKQKQSKIVLNKYAVGFWCKKTREDGFFHWRKSYYGLWTCYLVRSDGLKLKHLMNLFCTNRFASQDWTGLEWCGLLVDYCDVFIRCLDIHSDGTHSLQSIHWWTSDVMLNFSKSALMKKQTHLLDGLMVSTFSANVNFWVNYSFKSQGEKKEKSFRPKRSKYWLFHES